MKKKILSVLAVCLLVILMVGSVNHLLSRKSSQVKYQDFYDEKADFDVLFLGSSHMVMGVLPMELWDDYGIVSYNLANYGQWLPGDYWALKNALQFTNPKVVVIDVHALISNDKSTEANMAQLHELFDIMPLSKVKIDAINDMFEANRRLEFLIPFSLYHSRWDSVDSSFFESLEISTEKGADADYYSSKGLAQVSPSVEPVLLDNTCRATENSLGREYLEKIIQLCEENDIKVLLTALPYVANEEQQLWVNAAYDIAVEHDLEFCNMLVEDVGFSYMTDLYDIGHINSSGARKVTKYLGEKLSNEYGIADNRQNSLYSGWNSDFEEYLLHKESWIKMQDELYPYMMLMQDEDFECKIYISGQNMLRNDPEFAALLKNLGQDSDSYVVNSDEVGENVRVEVNNLRTGNQVEIVEFAWNESGYFHIR